MAPSDTPSSSPLAELFPFLADLDAERLADLERHAPRVRLSPGSFVCMAGDLCSGLPLLTAGSVRVYAMSASGRETTLYRIGPGESCILTAGCLLEGLAFPAFARVEDDAEALLVPPELFHRWFSESRPWSAWVVGLTTRRLAETITRMHDLLYRPLPARLAEYLLAAADDADTVSRTHADIASEIGAAREAVSRSLKGLEAAGAVALRRGVVGLVDRAALREVARRGAV